jgi:hypothetical protein
MNAGCVRLQLTHPWNGEDVGEAERGAEEQEQEQVQSSRERNSSF